MAPRRRLPGRAQPGVARLVARAPTSAHGHQVALAPDLCHLALEHHLDLLDGLLGAHRHSPVPATGTRARAHRSAHDSRRVSGGHRSARHDAQSRGGKAQHAPTATHEGFTVLVGAHAAPTPSRGAARPAARAARPASGPLRRVPHHATAAAGALESSPDNPVPCRPSAPAAGCAAKPAPAHAPGRAAPALPRARGGGHARAGERRFGAESHRGDWRTRGAQQWRVAGGGAQRCGTGCRTCHQRLLHRD